MKVRDKKENSPPEKSEISINSTENRITYRFIGLAEPQKFKIIFQFKEFGNDLFVGKNINGNTYFEKIDFNEKNEWVEENIPEYSVFTFDFGYMDGSDFKSIQKLELKKPIDLVIDGPISWSEIVHHFDLSPNATWYPKDFHRLFLKEKSILVTNGESLRIEIPEVFSENGSIATWPPGSEAAPQTRGLGGGKITLLTEQLSGRINFYLRGQKGGTGLVGSADTTLNGSQGLPGVDMKYEITPYNCGHSEFPCLTLYKCLSPPGEGKIGSDGKMGRKGGTGYNGGSTGSLQLICKDLSQAEWNLIYEPGEGGNGGPGGPGGEGGPGGAPGSHQTLNNGQLTLVCEPASTGKKGQQGPQGPNGDKGAEGIKETSCIQESNKPIFCL